MVLLKNVGFVVGKQQFCGGGGDNFADGKIMKIVLLMVMLTLIRKTNMKMLCCFEDSGDNDHVI